MPSWDYGRSEAKKRARGVIFRCSEVRGLGGGWNRSIGMNHGGGGPPELDVFRGG